MSREALARKYCDGRHKFWQYLVVLQRAFDKNKPFRSRNVGIDEPPPPFQIKWLAEPIRWATVFRMVD